MTQKAFGDFYSYLHCVNMLQTHEQGVTPKVFLESVKKKPFFHKDDPNSEASKVWARRIMEAVYRYHGEGGDAPDGMSDLISSTRCGKNTIYKLVEGKRLDIAPELSDNFSPFLLLQEQLENLFLPNMGKKVEAMFDLINSKHELDSNRYAYSRDTYEAVPPSLNEQVLSDVEKALDSKKSMSFTYNGKKRTVEPFGLYVHGKIFYLIAMELSKRGDEAGHVMEKKWYAIHRMTETEILSTGSSLLANDKFSVAEYLSSEAGKFFNGGELVEVTLKMPKDKSGKNKYVDEFKVGQNQVILDDQPDYYLVRALANDCLDFRKFLMNNTYYMELIYPESIREDIVNQIKSAAQTYSA